MTESELGTLEEAHTIAVALRAALPEAVDAIKQGITHKTVFYLLVARESLLHRVPEGSLAGWRRLRWRLLLAVARSTIHTRGLSGLS